MTLAQEVKRQEAVKAAAELTQALVDHLNVGVAQVGKVLSCNANYYKVRTFLLGVFSLLSTKKQDQHRLIVQVWAYYEKFCVYPKINHLGSGVSIDFIC